MGFLTDRNCCRRGRIDDSKLRRLAIDSTHVLYLLSNYRDCVRDKIRQLRRRGVVLAWDVTP